MSERSTPPVNGNGDAETDDDAPLLLETALKWVQQDPNPTTGAHVEQLLLTRNDDESLSALRAMFTVGRIAFGTAGLRSSMAPGPLNMNDLVVVQAAQGIAWYCHRLFQTVIRGGSPSAATSLAIVPEDHKDKRLRVSNDTEEKKRLCVVIGYDHRASEEWNLSSRHFAVLTALVFQQLDCFEVVLLEGYVMTPLVPFAMQQQKTATCYGIMVTASHNPKQDAGYKVYWSDGCQIRSPTDQHLAESIHANLTPWIDYAAVLQSRRATFPNDPCYGLSHPQQTQKCITAYFQSLLAPVGMLSGKSNANTEWNNDATSSDQTQQQHQHQRRPTFCYTAMHGVGYRFAQQCFATCHLPPFVSVPQQQEPDPTFATVSFPNPEEPGTLDLALQHAAEHDCCIVLANDPDADRLAVAERNDLDGTSSSNSDNESSPWTIFTGDQIGVLLGHWLWEQHCQNSTASNTVPAMCASTVSSRMLATIADAECFHFEDTLTGFKWIGARAAALHGSPVLVETHQSGSAADNASSSTTTTTTGSAKQMKTYKTLFCYEEAIGFCCGSVIFDKDGISAMGAFAELTYKVYRRGLTLRQHLQSLYDKYGEFVSNNGYFIMKDNRVVGPIMDRITNHGAFDTLARSVGPYPVSSVRYLGEPGYDSLQLPDHKPTLPCSRSAPMVTLRFENGCVAQFRASGTEPKFKYYLELKGQPGVPHEVVARELQIMSKVLLDTLLEPEKNGLERPKTKQ